MAKFTVEFDDVATYAALVYRLKTLTQDIEHYFGRAGDIIFPERREIETVLNDSGVGRWELVTHLTIAGRD